MANSFCLFVSCLLHVPVTDTPWDSAYGKQFLLVCFLLASRASHTHSVSQGPILAEAAGPAGYLSQSQSTDTSLTSTGPYSRTPAVRAGLRVNIGFYATCMTRTGFETGRGHLNHSAIGSVAHNYADGMADSDFLSHARAHARTHTHTHTHTHTRTRTRTNTHTRARARA